MLEGAFGLAAAKWWDAKVHPLSQVHSIHMAFQSRARQHY